MWTIFSTYPNLFKLAYPCSSRFKINGMRFFLPKFENLYSTLFKTRKYGIVVDVNVAVEEFFIHENSYLFVIVVAVLYFLMERKEKEEVIWERRGEKGVFFNYYYLFNHWWVELSFNFKIKKIHTWRLSHLRMCLHISIDLIKIKGMGHFSKRV